MDLKLRLNQSLKLGLSLEMKLSIDILKMSLKELKDFLKEKEQINPGIEIVYPKQIKSNSAEIESYIENISESEESLIKFLEEQIGYLNVSKEIKNILEYLINNLDERGYLDGTLESLKKDGGYKSSLFKEALDILRGLDPLGVGAFNLIDCLKIQLLNRGIKNKKIEKIIEENLEDIANKNFNKVCLERKIELSTLNRYIEFIKTLNPKPARGYYVNKKTKYIIPDIFVDIVNGELVISLNEEDIPKIKVRADSRESYNLALTLERSIQKRQKTLLRVSNYILNYQKDFIFKNGSLKTLKIKDIAYDLDLHESTISRAIKDKFLKRGKRIESLKKYIVLDEKSQNIKVEILKIIELEDKKIPLSDEKILKILLKKGVEIQRRTIAKYREELGIPSSRSRKK
ncbi:RNA polymerase factor sigma-54 [Cetobacterium sp.]|uniref:RNA polymerase factor sigma-54 n=1 Tax=Cetobacterium sp. TaxID=2071632 RepID=UPI003F35090E